MPYPRNKKAKILENLRAEVIEAIEDKKNADPVIAYGDPYQIAKGISLGQDWGMQPANWYIRTFNSDKRSALMDIDRLLTILLVFLAAASALGVWYGNYVRTYLEREVRQLIKVQDLGTFQRFLKMCTGRALSPSRKKQ